MIWWCLSLLAAVFIAPLLYHIFLGPHQDRIGAWVRSSPNRVVHYLANRTVRNTVTGQAHQNVAMEVRAIAICILGLPLLAFVAASEGQEAGRITAQTAPLSENASESAEDTTENADQEVFVGQVRLGSSIAAFGFVLVVGTLWAGFQRFNTIRFERFMQRLLPLLSQDELKMIVHHEEQLLNDKGVFDYAMYVTVLSRKYGFGDAPGILIEIPEVIDDDRDTD
jgi:hypothetical protein